MNKQSEITKYPGFVDIHDHFRWPGTNKSENFESGTKAAIRGGVIMTNDMPNTPGRHTNDPERLSEKHEGVMEQSYHAMGLYSLLDVVENNQNRLESMARRSLAAKAYLGKTTGFEHLETLSAKDFESHIKEWHRVAPDKPIMIHRGNADLDEIIYYVAEKYRHPMHLCHTNTLDEVELIKIAKIRRGLPVTNGVCMHHLTKTSHDIKSMGSTACMVPGLVSQADAERLRYEFTHGGIDIIETDHAPHPYEAKLQAELENPGHTDPEGSSCNGVPGVQETLGLLLYWERTDRDLTKDRVVEAYSTLPARIMGVKISPSTYVEVSDELYQIDDDYAIESDTGRSLYWGCWAVGEVVNMKKLGVDIILDRKIEGRNPQVVTERGTVI